MFQAGVKDHINHIMSLDCACRRFYSTSV